jgi:hypothetical protein
VAAAHGTCGWCQGHTSWVSQACQSTTWSTTQCVR